MKTVVSTATSELFALSAFSDSFTLNISPSFEDDFIRELFKEFLEHGGYSTVPIL